MWFVPDSTLLAPAARAVMGKKMEIYAGLVENLDHHVGRLIDHLKKIGEYDNTIFIVFGDNGAEGTDLFEMIAGTPGTRDYLFASLNWSQTHPNAWGDPGSYVAYGPMWAQVSMTPFSQYKAWMGEGGIRNALIVSGPAVKRPGGSINAGLMHVADVMPTLLEIAGARYPASRNGRDLPPLAGKSWGRVLAGEAESPRTDADYLAWEVFGNRALRRAARQAEGDGRALGRLRPREQRHPAQPVDVRDPRGPAAPARPGRPGLPAAALQAAVRPAAGHAGGAGPVKVTRQQAHRMGTA
jgi:arylsulfatase